LKLLSTRQIYAVYLVKGCGFTQSKAAYIMGVSRSAICQHIKRAKLKSEMDLRLNVAQKHKQIPYI